MLQSRVENIGRIFSHRGTDGAFAVVNELLRFQRQGMALASVSTLLVSVVRTLRGRDGLPNIFCCVALIGGHMGHSGSVERSEAHKENSARVIVGCSAVFQSVKSTLSPLCLFINW